MNEQHGFWWDLFKTASNVMAILLAAAFGWLTRRFSKMDDRMNEMEREFTERSQQATTNIAVLQAYHQANTQRFDSIDETTKKIDAKLDRLIDKMTERRE